MRFYMMSFMCGFLFVLTFWGHLLPVRFPASELIALESLQDAPLETVAPVAATDSQGRSQEASATTITTPSREDVTTSPENITPIPIRLVPPTDTNNIYSMKDIEDTYGAFLVNEQRLAAEMNVEQLRLQQLLDLRDRQPDKTAFLNPGHPLVQAIRTLQYRIAELKSQRDANSSFTFYNITLKYSAIQNGLPVESKQRTNELLNYVTMVRFQNDASSSTYYSYPQSAAPLTLVEPYGNTTVDPLLYGPQLPSQQSDPLRQNQDLNGLIQTSPYQPLDPARSAI